MHKIDYSIKQKGAELSTGKLVKASTCMGPAVHVTPTNRPQKLQERKYVRGHDWSRERLLVKELDLGLGLPSANESPSLLVTCSYTTSSTELSSAALVARALSESQK